MTETYPRPLYHYHSVSHPSWRALVGCWAAWNLCWSLSWHLQKLLGFSSSRAGSHEVCVVIKPQETASRTEIVICQSCPASRCIKREKEEHMKPAKIPMSVCAFSSLNIKVFKLNPVTLPAGQTSLWVSCAYGREPLPLELGGVQQQKPCQPHTRPCCSTLKSENRSAGFFSLLPLWQNQSGWRQTLWLHVHLKALSDSQCIEQHEGSSFCPHCCMLTAWEEDLPGSASFLCKALLEGLYQQWGEAASQRCCDIGTLGRVLCG